MITVNDFLAYVEETTRSELWIDHDAYYFDGDVYIAAGVSTSYPSYYEFYIRNAKVERLYSVQEYILELWTVDPKVTNPFYLSENTIRFVTDDNEYLNPRKTELIFTGDEIFVTACDFPIVGWGGGVAISPRSAGAGGRGGNPIPKTCFRRHGT